MQMQRKQNSSIHRLSVYSYTNVPGTLTCQVEIAALMDIGQHHVSGIENRTDHHVSFIHMDTLATIQLVGLMGFKNL
jgi:uncharacterized protein (UPF0303 family)